MTADRKTLTTHVTLSKRTIPKPLASSKEKTRKKWTMEEGEAGWSTHSGRRGN